jgi:hypothetical protein
MLSTLLEITIVALSVGENVHTFTMKPNVHNGVSYLSSFQSPMYLSPFE